MIENEQEEGKKRRGNESYEERKGEAKRTGRGGEGREREGEMELALLKALDKKQDIVRSRGGWGEGAGRGSKWRVVKIVVVAY